MSGHKFDVKKLEKLNNPKRLEMIELGKIVDELQLLSESVLLDIGAGTGIFSEELLDLLPDSQCYALDISKEMIEWINQNRVPKLESRLKTKLMDENNLPLEDNIADLAFMITVHHELEDGAKLLKELKRVLKKDGKVLICDWKEGCHHHFVKKEKIIEDLKLAGFNNIKEIEASEKLVCLVGVINYNI